MLVDISKPKNKPFVKNKLTEDKMFCYLWEDLDDDNECKFGERFVKLGQDPYDECLKRIRQSLGVRKDRFDEGKIRIVAIWDVSDIAKTIGKNRKGGKVDDYIRRKIGYRKGSTGEVHRLSGDDMRIRVNKEVAKHGQELVSAKLSTQQFKIAEEVLNYFSSGSRIVLAELCARFGKTIWSASLAVATEVDVVIVASYVKTVFSSFAGDLTSFQQFANYVHIDASDDDYQERVQSALAAGKKVFVYLSLYNGTLRQSRIDFLFGLANPKMLIVDEADFGAHRMGQAMPLVEQIDYVDYTIVMTGTNADRAATFWPIDKIVSVTYPELLIQKSETRNENQN
jgi:hypothetical protein